MTAALILALMPSPVAAQRQVTAEEAMANYRKVFKPTQAVECPEGEGDIVVCATRGKDPARLPLPVEPEPGARVVGEPLRDSGGCISRCHQPMTINVIGAAITAARGLRRILQGE